MGMATLLDPRYKNEMLLVCFAMLHGISPSSPECEDHVNGIIAKICTLLEEYNLESDDDHGQPSSSFSSLEAPALMSLFNARVAQKRPASFSMKSELDRYLEDELVPLSKDKFSVLDWWKVSGTRYPTLRLLACDVFATPVSTVASESAFSTSGRVLSDHHSRPTPEILETLMCSQDWIRNKCKVADNEEGQSFRVVFKTFKRECRTWHSELACFEDCLLEAWRRERCHDDDHFKLICELQNHFRTYVLENLVSFVLVMCEP
uniref:HAT C-terminal dimerisation domain-containing protein n=1 Tax=Triticum urartu TaxID=4572 RepID=A0A8R7PTS4_TRIUA